MWASLCVALAALLAAAANGQDCSSYTTAPLFLMPLPASPGGSCPVHVETGDGQEGSVDIVCDPATGGVTVTAYLDDSCDGEVDEELYSCESSQACADDGYVSMCDDDIAECDTMSVMLAFPNGTCAEADEVVEFEVLVGICVDVTELAGTTFSLEFNGCDDGEPDASVYLSADCTGAVVGGFDLLTQDDTGLCVLGCDAGLEIEDFLCNPWLNGECEGDIVIDCETGILTGYDGDGCEGDAVEIDLNDPPAGVDQDDVDAILELCALEDCFDATVSFCDYSVGLVDGCVQVAEQVYVSSECDDDDGVTYNLFSSAGCSGDPLDTDTEEPPSGCDLDCSATTPVGGGDGGDGAVAAAASAAVAMGAAAWALQ